MTARTLILQSNLPDSGAIVQVWSDRPLSSWDIDQLMRELELRMQQAARRERAAPAQEEPR